MKQVSDASVSKQHGTPAHRHPEGLGPKDSSAAPEKASVEPAGELTSGLYIVATPIGNLEDMTLRALRVLRQVDVIACEDTRQTQKLLNHFSIKTKTVSYHQHNEAGRSEELLQRLCRGERVAVVSDAGTPGISDPGAALIAAAIAAGIAVIPAPGANAALAALMGAGLNTDSFVYLGFLPARQGERRSFLEALREEKRTVVCYEAPHRIAATLEDAAAVLGGNRAVVLARELTKVHEEFLRGTLDTVRAQVSRRENLRGEMVLLLAGSSGAAPRSTAQTLAQRVAELMGAERLDEKAALKRVARERNLSKSAAYREWQRARP